MVPRQQWRAKAVSEALKETRVEATEERGATDVEVLDEIEENRSDWPATPVGLVIEGSAQNRSDRPATPVRSVDGVSVQTEAEVLAPSQSCSETTTPAADEEEMLDYESSPVREDMDVNVIYLSFVDYSIVGDDEVVQRQYGLKINPLKCAFSVSDDKFLGFIIHEYGIEIDHKRIESMKKVKTPTCKKELQSFLGKLNYLRQLISNLSGRVKPFTPILRLKNVTPWFSQGKKTLENYLFK
jgi:hypothetical protein